MDRRVMGLAAGGAVGSVVVILYLTLVSHQPVFWFSVVLLGVLMVICETLGDEMAFGGRSTYGIIAIFGAIAALNTPSAVIVALFGAFHLRIYHGGEDPWKLVFNGGLYAACTWAAAAVYHGLGGVSRAFTLSDAGRSILPLVVAAVVFWALNTVFMAAAMRWINGTEPRDFFMANALKLLPNQIIYALVGLGIGIIYAQNAFIVVLNPEGQLVLDASGNPIVLGSIAASLRGLFAVLCVIAILGVAWYYSGKNIELLEAYDRSVEVLVTHLERREPYLDGHAVRVADYTALIARRLRLPFYEVNRLRHAALLHDLGRPAVPRGILMEPSVLTEEEFEKIKVHPLEGSTRLEEVEYLSDMAEAVRHHHEYYDGGGYIDHLAGETIPLSARIIAVADAYDAMLNKRPWREAKGRDRALAELRENSGRQFDPEIVEEFIAALEVPERVETGPPAGAYPGQEIEPAEPSLETTVEKKHVRGRSRKREEMLRARRESRERLEKEALHELSEEPGGEIGPEAPRDRGREPPDEAGPGGEGGAPHE